MSWQSLQMANQFLAKANAIYPEEEFDADAKLDLKARQEVLYECYMNSFSEAKVLEYLNKTVSGEVNFPPDVDKEAYKSAAIKHAKSILSELQSRKW